MLLKEPDTPVFVVINRQVDAQRFEQVKKGCTFLPELPKKMDQYAFSRILVNELKSWQARLESYAFQAEQPYFPGSKDIKNGILLLDKMLENQDSYSMIILCLKYQSRIAQLGKKVAELTWFYTKKHLFWQMFINRMQAFKTNLADIKSNKQIFSAHQRLSEIINSPCPFPLIAEAERLLTDVQTFHEQVEREKITAFRSKALAKTDKMIRKLITLLDTFENDQEYRNHCLHELRIFYKKIEKSNRIDNIRTTFNDAKDFFVDVIEEM